MQPPYTALGKMDFLKYIINMSMKWQSIGLKKILSRKYQGGAGNLPVSDK